MAATPLVLMKDIPRYDCLLEAARQFPDLNPSATEAFLHLLRSGDEAFKLAEANLARHDISQGRFGVLMSLLGHCRRNGGPCSLTPAELAEHAGVTRATMTGLIDTLVKDGLVTRAPHADDRRMMCVELTERGRTLLSEILPGHFRQMAWLLQPLSESERATLVDLLRKIEQRAVARVAGEAPGAESPTS